MGWWGYYDHQNDSVADLWFVIEKMVVPKNIFAQIPKNTKNVKNGLFSPSFCRSSWVSRRKTLVTFLQLAPHPERPLRYIHHIW